MAIPKPYQYKIDRRRKPKPPEANPLPRVADTKEDEGLTGFVQGKAVGSDGEERLARAWDRLNERYLYQYEVQTPYSLPGQGKQIDFIKLSARQPVEVDGIWHRTESSQQADAIRDAVLNDILQRQGFRPIVRIPYERLANQREADRTATEIS